MFDDNEPIGVDIDEVIRRVKEALVTVQREQAARATGTGIAVDVERLELTLRTVAHRSGGGDISLRIPVIGQELGGGVELSRQEVQSIELSLVPPAGLPKGVGKWDIEHELVEAILGIEDGVRSAADSDPKFGLEEATIELNLVVGKEGRLSLVGRGSAGVEAAHTLKIYLKPRTAPF